MEKSKFIEIRSRLASYLKCDINYISQMDDNQANRFDEIGRLYSKLIEQFGQSETKVKKVKAELYLEYKNKESDKKLSEATLNALVDADDRLAQARNERATLERQMTSAKVLYEAMIDVRKWIDRNSMRIKNAIANER